MIEDFKSDDVFSNAWSNYTKVYQNIQEQQKRYDDEIIPRMESVEERINRTISRYFQILNQRQDDVEQNGKNTFEEIKTLK